MCAINTVPNIWTVPRLGLRDIQLVEIACARGALPLPALNVLSKYAVFSGSACRRRVTERLDCRCQRRAVGGEQMSCRGEPGRTSTGDWLTLRR
ncbi:hypothetical protein JOB18_026159 [Solea senegalensis]|uniref:Uncharacterized protein n=1 Tax=Solea senegalensis TaxID=28829 RepID=A0AAV6SZQ5_SOLSE|nr:hypothetical protein JOB18_026159 [Solea senegalensis]